MLAPHRLSIVAMSHLPSEGRGQSTPLAFDEPLAMFSRWLLREFLLRG